MSLYICLLLIGYLVDLLLENHIALSQHRPEKLISLIADTHADFGHPLLVQGINRAIGLLQLGLKVFLKNS